MSEFAASKMGTGGSFRILIRVSAPRSSEGKKVKIPYRGELKDTIQDILGGIRSSCTYVGAPSLKQLSKCTTFVRVHNQYNDTFGRI